MRVHSVTVLSGQRWEHPKVHQQANNTMCRLQPENITTNERSQTRGQVSWLHLYEISRKTSPQTQLWTGECEGRRAG